MTQEGTLTADSVSGREFRHDDLRLGGDYADHGLFEFWEEAADPRGRDGFLTEC